MSTRERPAAILAAALLLWQCAACRDPGTPAVRGILLDVQARDLTTVDAVVLRDEAGNLHPFRVALENDEAGHPVTASHLREHMTRGEVIIVHYRDAPDGRVAIRITDAMGPATTSPGSARR